MFVSDDDVTTPPVISDSLFDAASRGIRFKVNRTELQSSEPFVSLYCERLVPWLKSQDMELRQVYVKGAASPEGPYLNNVRLGRECTQRLIEFLNSKLGQPVSAQRVSAQSINEDYGLLVKQLREAGDPDYEKVNAIYQECKADEACCKRRLMALEQGRVWARLKVQYFPSLRQSRVILWFARKSDSPLRLLSAPVEPARFVAPPVCMDTNITVKIPFIEPVADVPVAYSRRHLIAARTNLVHDLLYVPQFGWAYGGNIQLEYYPLRGHYTYNAGFTFTNHRHWSEYKQTFVTDINGGIATWQSDHTGYDAHSYVYQPANYPKLSQ